jgi:hypothetical protein
MTQNNISYTGININGRIFYQDDYKDKILLDNIIRFKGFYLINPNDTKYKYPYIIVNKTINKKYKYKIIVQYYQLFDVIKTNNLNIV